MRLCKLGKVDEYGLQSSLIHLADYCDLTQCNDVSVGECSVDRVSTEASPASLWA
jgi:hypothetical protein